ncbi:hypothetical protein [Cerasicoccus fimbriatus]|uniref:hypothetical protein n=1 Tax=Cerasicoccus fimbriatus TaxID=3014554 RepID=UPI0022B39C64|nr:hypothetical protein [Cerasicoccus sp. TK19100]
MNAVATKHPFPLTPRPNQWFLPAMLAPSLYIMVSFAFYWGSGNPVLCSPALLLITGFISLAYCGRAIYRDSREPRHRQISLFVGIVFLIYLQQLLPRLWGWPVH